MWGNLFVASTIVRFRYGPPVCSPSWLTGPGWSLAPAKPTMAFYIPARGHRVAPIPVGHATAPNQELRRRDSHPLVQQLDSLHDLPGSLAVHPVTLRRSTTPDDPLRLACSGAPGTAPTRLTMKASSICRFRGRTPLRHLLSTLHDGRCRTPCRTRFRLAGCAFAGRESNPLDRDEGFQFMTSSFPGLALAQQAFGRANRGDSAICAS